MMERDRILEYPQPHNIHVLHATVTVSTQYTDRQTAAIRHKVLCILLQNSPSSVDSPCSVDTVDKYGHVCAKESCNRLQFLKNKPAY